VLRKEFSNSAVFQYKETELGLEWNDGLKWNDIRSARFLKSLGI